MPKIYPQECWIKYNMFPKNNIVSFHFEQKMQKKLYNIHINDKIITKILVVMPETAIISIVVMEDNVYNQRRKCFEKTAY